MLTHTLTAQGGGAPQQLSRAEWSPDGALVAATVHPDYSVVVWDLASDSSVVLAAKGERFTFSSEGTQLLVLMENGRFALCDAFTGERVDEFMLEATYGPRSVGAIASHPHDSTVTVIRRSPGVGALPYVWVESWSAGYSKPATYHSSPRWEARRRVVGRDRNAPPPLGRWSPDGETFAFAVGSATVELVSSWGHRKGSLSGHSAGVHDIAWHPEGFELATASADATIWVWDTESRRPTFMLEGHTAEVRACQYSADGTILGTLDAKGEVRIWDTDAWSLRERFTLDAPWLNDERTIARFHPRDPQRLAISSRDRDRLELHAFEPLAPGEVATHRHYVNATVLLVGDSGVGKSGLGLVLTGKDFKPTESTHNRWIWVLDATEAEAGEHQEIREVFLWDLAGQPGYRLIHQLHLGQADVTLVVFDARSETDPFGGARYWARALRQIEQAEGASGAIRFLVAARSDRGSVAVSQARVDEFMAAYGFAEYFETSAKEGWNIEELADAIRAAVPWERLPRVSSSDLFLSIK